MNLIKNQPFRKAFKDSADLKKSISTDSAIDNLVFMGDCITQSILKGGKLLICGNGGSAADAQHLAAELLIRLKPTNNRKGIPAIALAMDSSTLTACGNDFGYDVLFSRMVETLGQEGDVLLGITTSGNSKNVNEAFKAANSMGIQTFGFLGSGGGNSIKICDNSFLVPSGNTARIQEAHITAGHALMEYIEDSLIQEGFLKIEQ